MWFVVWGRDTLDPAGGAADGPSSRTGYGLAADPHSGVMYVFGGVDMLTRTLMGDLWQFSTSTYADGDVDDSTSSEPEGRWMQLLPVFSAAGGSQADSLTAAAATDSWPLPRKDHTLTFLAPDRLFLFGGQGLRSGAGTAATSARQNPSAFAELNDLWSFHIPSRRWTHLAGSADPAASSAGGTIEQKLMSRSLHSSFALLTSVIFFGGRGNSDMVVFDSKSKTTSSLSQSVPADLFPQNASLDRSSFVALALRGRVFLVGTTFSDVLEFNFAQCRWKRLAVDTSNVKNLDGVRILDCCSTSRVLFVVDSSGWCYVMDPFSLEWSPVVEIRALQGLASVSTDAERFLSVCRCVAVSPAQLAVLFNGGDVPGKMSVALLRDPAAKERDAASHLSPQQQQHQQRRSHGQQGADAPSSEQKDRAPESRPSPRTTPAKVEVPALKIAQIQHAGSSRAEQPASSSRGGSGGSGNASNPSSARAASGRGRSNSKPNAPTSARGNPSQPMQQQLVASHQRSSSGKTDLSSPKHLASYLDDDPPAPMNPTTSAASSSPPPASASSVASSSWASSAVAHSTALAPSLSPDELEAIISLHAKVAQRNAEQDVATLFGSLADRIKALEDQCTYVGNSQNTLDSQLKQVLQNAAASVAAPRGTGSDFTLEDVEVLVEARLSEASTKMAYDMSELRAEVQKTAWTMRQVQEEVRHLRLMHEHVLSRANEADRALEEVRGEQKTAIAAVISDLQARIESVEERCAQLSDIPILETRDLKGQIADAAPLQQQQQQQQQDDEHLSTQSPAMSPPVAKELASLAAAQAMWTSDMEQMRQDLGHRMTVLGSKLDDDVRRLEVLYERRAADFQTMLEKYSRMVDEKLRSVQSVSAEKEPACESVPSHAESTSPEDRRDAAAAAANAELLVRVEKLHRQLDSVAALVAQQTRTHAELAEGLSAANARVDDSAIEFENVCSKMEKIEGRFDQFLTEARRLKKGMLESQQQADAPVLRSAVATDSVENTHTTPSPSPSPSPSAASVGTAPGGDVVAPRLMNLVAESLSPPNSLAAPGASLGQHYRSLSSSGAPVTSPGGQVPSPRQTTVQHPPAPLALYGPRSPPVGQQHPQSAKDDMLSRLAYVEATVRKASEAAREAVERSLETVRVRMGAVEEKIELLAAETREVHSFSQKEVAELRRQAAATEQSVAGIVGAFKHLAR